MFFFFFLPRVSCYQCKWSCALLTNTSSKTRLCYQLCVWHYPKFKAVGCHARRTGIFFLRCHHSELLPNVSTVCTLLSLKLHSKEMNGEKSFRFSFLCTKQKAISATFCLTTCHLLKYMQMWGLVGPSPRNITLSSIDRKKAGGLIHLSFVTKIEHNSSISTVITEVCMCSWSLKLCRSVFSSKLRGYAIIISYQNEY
jgi:hypothetical protein